ncbi:MFS transporter [Pseudoxanthomonas wuyuanensis]|uniref:Maltose/moltooligosaccharide transporter n=1 Tax=Pseudoxanthomonas wuyuanensis TaxID=1073196 RepID=A0A286CVZ6_9GAMM|nr:MFS transporter [Pseudoxanthomonas wuyuanensis]KAF1721262.1 MFS transporter [Pseudoxanthomonas wuyuanensis]SOD50535.1 maltose/moltooligosaccharide transporter [Pseudoxanthomonas wuyuanensis]
MTEKPRLSFWQIWNMCFGFLGIQFGFALQNANVSRIFQTLGADIEDIPMLWVAAPLTGLIVQPIVGYFSDRTWTRLGRRRPYFLYGALLATLALFFMPNSPALWIAAGLLWVLDASINISMEPFRAFVGDQLAPRQRPAGYAMQSFFIGIGSVVASLLPWLLTRLGVANVAADGGVPDTVKWAFYAGGAILFLAVAWTVLSTREYSPEQLAGFDDAGVVDESHASLDAGRARREGGFALLIGAAGIAAILALKLDKQLFVLAGGIAAYGLILLAVSLSRTHNMFSTIAADLHAMPATMRQLAVVQFFSWFALFSMWIYTTPAVTQVHFGAADTSSAAYNEGANWVGVLFAAYNGFAALAAIVIPLLVRMLGLRVSHLINVCLGSAGLLSFLFVRDPQWLLLSMVGVGFAWASILSLPYALLSDSLPAQKMGIYMGIFNFFIVIPQLVAASILGFLLKTFAGGQPIYALAIGGVSLLISGLCVLRVRESPLPSASQAA